VIEDVAPFRTGADLSSAHPVREHRMRAHRPVDDVDVVHVLFDDVIAGEPGEVEPVAQLPLDVAPLGLTILLPEKSLVPCTSRRDDLADRPVLDPLERFQIPV
jgi:hypothetical protein